GVHALRQVNLRVEKGEFVFLVGATGAGKSTLLKLITREVLPTSGKVIVAGRNVADIPAHEVPYYRRMMGVVFQDFGLLPNKTVWENVAFALRVLGLPRKEIRKRTAHAIEMV
ncbi:MAG: ATP-binding cassette domain-containing protein, partial [Armatimonadota bacterium]|nr:ATP-binding cassette domain-containing protein [Armatimonadota bacterium]